MKRILTTAALAAGVMLAGQAMAAPLIWQNNSLTYLYGKNFAVDSAGGKEADIQQIVTFEHASGWTWGDIFMFVDNKWYNGISGGAGHTYYGESSLGSRSARSRAQTSPSVRSTTCYSPVPMSEARVTKAGNRISPIFSAQPWIWPFPASTASRSTPTTVSPMVNAARLPANGRSHPLGR